MPSILIMLVTITLVGFLQLKGSVPNVSAVQSQQGIGIYMDLTCSQKISAVDWGALSPGQIKEVTVYVRNEGNAPILLTLTTTNYNPTNAAIYINFTWSCTNRKIEANKTVQVTQNLQISPQIKGIYEFSFDIAFDGETYIPGDINKDGRVNIIDAIIFSSTYGSTPRDNRWNPDADLNGDGFVNILDAVALGLHFK